MLAAPIRLLIAALWGGSLWTIGLAAGALFSALPDQVLAGTIAAHLFRWEAWLSLCCAVLLALPLAVARTESTGQRKTLLQLISAMLVCTLIGYFGLHPFMSALREAAGPGGVMASDDRMRFGILHAVSSGLYLIESVLGVMLILKSA